jgi:hypothetical protein
MDQLVLLVVGCMLIDIRERAEHRRSCNLRRQRCNERRVCLAPHLSAVVADFSADGVYYRHIRSERSSGGDKFSRTGGDRGADSGCRVLMDRGGVV